MKVLLTVGTHEQPFQRLLDAAQQTIPARPDDEWVVQYGVGAWTLHLPSIRAAADYFDAPDMQAHLAWADLVVSQCSPGTVFGALAAEAWPLVLGRQIAFDEHVDDHQVLFARELDSTDRQRRCRQAADRSAENATRFRADVWRVLGSVA
jgi:UDP-N-acetylglucosamine transferase subunit ALG13